MESLFSADFFVGNRLRLRELFTGTAPIVITANGLLQRSNDTTFEFHQDANFWYLTGINEPGFILVMDKDKEYLVAPKRSRAQHIFDGTYSNEEITQDSGISEVLENKDGLKRLFSRIKKVKHVATIAPSQAFVEVYGMFTNPARAELVANLKAENNDLEVLDLKQHLAQLRMVKQPIELQAIKRAIQITNSSLRQLKKKGWGKFSNTFAIETELIKLFRSKGAEGVAFDSVIAAGADTCVVHSTPNRSPLAGKELILVDVGAAVGPYCADISRTYALSIPSKRLKQVYTAVLEVQNHAITLLKPGVVVKQYEEAIEVFMGEKLRELGLIKTIDHDSVRNYFPHATSHHLGIDVHDMAEYGQPLRPNMVLTVEPGIYVPEEGIGIRIEDDVLITKNGNRILSASLPRVLA